MIASLAFWASLAESMTPLIFAGPPLMFNLGDVGVLGDGCVTMGDLGTGLGLICLEGGALMGCAFSVVFNVVVGGGPGLLSFASCILSIIEAAFDLSLGFEGDVREGFCCSWPEASARPRFVALEGLFGASGVFSRKADPFRMVPKPPCSSAPFEVGLGSGTDWTPFLITGGFSVISLSTTAFSCIPPMLLTSLALLRPSIVGPPFSPGLSTATKLARTLLTGLLVLENSDGFGERPRLGGDVD